MIKSEFNIKRMKRRKFTKLTGAGMILPLIGKDTNILKLNDDASQVVGNLLSENDSRIPLWLQNQEKDTTSRWYGGIRTESGVFYPGHAAGFIKNLSCSYTSPKSRHYKSGDLLNAMKIATEYLLISQYKDGNIDLPSTNFHSPPDTAFVVEPLCIAYNLINSLDAAETKELIKDLKRFLLSAGEALMIGGIHTANHRWVVCMALARLNELFPNEGYLIRIDQWLAEKIDIDPDGQYAERSTLIYTPLVNRCLITIARLTDKPELFEPVRNNLEMTLYYIHPNGEIATESSGRQDRYQRGTMQNYLYAYRYLSILDSNGKFAQMTQNILQMDPGKLLFWLGYFLEDPFLSEDLSQADPLPVDYLKEFYHSDMIRIRRDNMDASILSDNPIFLTFFKGDAALESVRMASAFFGKGQFKAQTLERSGDTFILRQKLVGPYYQPLSSEDIPEDGNGWEVPRMKRKQSEVQEQETTIKIRENDGKINLEISVTGTDNVPVAVEMAFRLGGRLMGVTEVKGIENAYLPIEEDLMQYTFGSDTISFGPGIREHAWTQLRGSLPKLDADCVYLTGFTPFDTTIEIQ
jgi:hypothetical protein